ncbi:peptidylprolyl isomerase [Legionella londiniensis]|uniref:Peptidyl-prolyl cis-trans isomerase n=1 Tax=Legionella londiniensis TaxID=45068 RepID=A0A0W0VSV1_9GAMM|nr:peptidylprolyl isomerase [Legionella londiniensis]KTD23053.1 peptidyl-prolyl cis-trans isomerase B [Legionella londiniensis]STX94070.1 peptidyl-prolyl cis-trans isomerase B (cyclophilin B) [Legionella londiniensis]
MILIQTTKGDIRIELDTVNTPHTSANFLNYVRQGFYERTLFHRVIDGFMIQGGGFTSGMKIKETGAPIKNEAQAAKPNKRGTIAMARTMEPHSATVQFFINVADNEFLNFTGVAPQTYGYCVFGEVIEGMDVVDAISKVKTGSRFGHRDVPLEDIEILKIVEDEKACV